MNETTLETAENGSSALVDTALDPVMSSTDTAAQAVQVTQETFLQPYLEPVLGSWLYVDSNVWTVVGMVGTILFGSRFLVQWLYSEKKGHLVIPPVFWHLSFWGSVISMVYFLHLDKAPVILGNCFLPFLYGRNLMLLYRGKHKKAAQEESA